MSSERQRGKRSVKEVKEELLHVLHTTESLQQLRTSLDRLSNELCFGGLTYIWGPLVYQRAPRIFRPFILRHFSSYLISPKWSFKAVRWKGEVADLLEPWLAQVDADDEIELFKRLYFWKMSELNIKKAMNCWQHELLERFRKRHGAAERKIELAKLNLGYWLNQETAIALYQTDPLVTSDFIIGHLPRKYSLFGSEKREFWETLADLAQKKQDEDFYFKLYREQVPIARWREDALALCRTISKTERLLDELIRRHPNTWSKDFTDAFCELLEMRGEELFPYIVPRLRQVMRSWFRGSFERLVRLAEEKNWMVLWAGLHRTCSTEKEYNQAVLESLNRSPAEARQRLALLAGIGHEWNFSGFGIATLNYLTDKTAVAVYQLYPQMLRGPLKVQIHPRWNETYPGLLELLLQNDDEELIDYLAARLVNQSSNWGEKKLLQTAEKLAEHYEKLQGRPEEFARRAASVLSLVPPYVFWNYAKCIRNNRLSRLLYERQPESYLACPSALQDLLEAPEIHAQHLAYKALSSPHPKARELARGNLTILLGTLLRPLHRRTRLSAFSALDNACHDLPTAQRVIGRVRMALELPDIRYPKDELTGLLGKLLHRFPDLREADEQPVIYGVSPC